MTGPPAARLVTLTPAGLQARLAEALDVYVTAMGYPPGTAQHRAPLWLEHMRRTGWRGVAALDANDAVVGIVYGYRGGAGQWWYEQVRKGLASALPPAQVDSWLTDYFEFTELHVLPRMQGHGLGEQLLRAVLAEPSPASRVLLSTPEGPSRAWRLYRRLGFLDLLRDHRFAGDPRKFAVLGRTLPL